MRSSSSGCRTSLGGTAPTLPELHLLPRVQYLLIAKAEHELEVPDPTERIDPHTALRFVAPPDDPLRFEAYWPNEDSPLEDLILLRSDDERLSVRAEVAGGVGQVEVYWVLDGRLNHRGLASDDVQLLPGKHDDARLYATDGSGQAVTVELPRVVKLPPLELPEIVYGVNAWGLSKPVEWDLPPWQYSNLEERTAVVRGISEIGFQFVRFPLHMGMLLHEPGPRWDNTHLDWLIESMSDLGLQPLLIVGPYSADSARSTDVGDDRPYEFLGQEARDPKLIEEQARRAARRWPSIRFFEVSNEPSLKTMRVDLDPVREAQQQRATALGIWYENPRAVIIAGTPCCTWFDVWIEDGIRSRHKRLDLPGGDVRSGLWTMV